MRYLSITIPCNNIRHGRTLPLFGIDSFNVFGICHGTLSSWKKKGWFLVNDNQRPPTAENSIGSARVTLLGQCVSLVACAPAALRSLLHFSPLCDITSQEASVTPLCQPWATILPSPPSPLESLRFWHTDPILTRPISVPSFRTMLKRFLFIRSCFVLNNIVREAFPSPLNNNKVQINVDVQFYFHERNYIPFRRDNLWAWASATYWIRRHTVCLHLFIVYWVPSRDDSRN